MLLDMINKQQTSVNVCSYRHWMTGCNWLQPVWCNKAHYYANPASPSDSSVVCCEWARRKRDNQESVRLKGIESEWMAVCQCDRSVFVCTPVCPTEMPENTKAAASLVSSALTTLLVIMMTFEKILIEDKRLNSEWVDLSTANLQLSGWESTLETM